MPLLTLLRVSSLFLSLLLCLAASQLVHAEKLSLDQPFTDPATPLKPVKTRTDTDRERLRAAALLMDARILERRGQLIPALRKYQRAWRLDNRARVALKQTVSLCLQLGRVEEATRYALLLTNSDLNDPFLAERMAMLMADQLEYDRSLRLYQHVLKLRAKEPNTRHPIAMHFEMGRLYFLADEHEQAAQSFGVVLDAIEDPNNEQLSDEVRQAILAEPGLAYNLIAESFLEAGRYDDAMRLFEKAAKSQKSPQWLTFQQARVDYRAGKYRQAEEKLNAYIKQRLRFGGRTPYELLQSLMEATSDDDDEKNDKTRFQKFRDWLADDPENFPLLSYVADLTRKQGGLDDAAKLYEKSVAAQPTLDGFRNLIETYRMLKDERKLLGILGRVGSELKSLAPFEDELRPVVEDQDFLNSLYEFGRAKSSTAETKVACCLLAIQAEDHSVATEFLKKLPSDAKYFAVHEQLGLSLLNPENAKQAIDVFRGALDEGIAEGNEAATLYYLSGALQIAGQTDAALKAARQAATAVKDVPEVSQRPAWILYNADRIDEAKEEYQRWLDKHGEDYASPAVRDTVRNARFALSSICQDLGQIDEAAEWLEQILNEYPEDVSASNDLGYLLADEGRSLPRAMKMIRLAVEAEPDNAAYRDSLGWALYRAGRFEEAVTELRKASSDPTPDPIILDHLADALRANGDTTEACQVWQRALSLMEESDDRDDELVTAVQRKRKQSLAESN